MNTSPDMPSTRPMTLRQQLDDLLGYLDEEHVYPLRMSRVEVRNAIEELCQEIAREAYDKGYDDCLEEHGAVFKKEQE